MPLSLKNLLLMLFGVLHPILTQTSKKNIVGGIAALSFSAVGLILLGHWPEQKTAQKANAAMSFLLFALNFKLKMLVGLPICDIG